MEVEKLILKWKIPMAWLASEIGMSRGVFNNKLKRNNNKYNYFRPNEIEKIKAVFYKLKEDIDKIQ